MSNSKDQITFPNSQSPIPIYNKSGTIRKKIGRKRENTGLRNRKDVVLKTLLRKIRNHFWQDLNSETRYYKHKRNRGSLYYERCLRNYIENKLGEVASKDFMFIFGSIVSHSDMEQLIIKGSTNLFEQEESENLLKQIKDIHQILYKFSVSKFSILSRRPEMLNLILQFEKVKRSWLNRDENIGIQILINEWIKNIY